MDDATKGIVALDDAVRRYGRCGDGAALIQALVRSAMIVVCDILRQDAPEVALVRVSGASSTSARADVI